MQDRLLLQIALIVPSLAVACVPSADTNSKTTEVATSVQSPNATNSANAGPIMDAGADADNSAGATYARREWVITRGGGTVVFESPGEWVCKPLPETRPADFTLILEKRGSEPGDWTYFGVAESLPCRFAWGMPWMEPNPAVCKTIDKIAFDRLYQQLRTLSPHSIRSRRMTEYVSPHRGGWGIHLRWANTECNISDILDNEVDPADRPRFDAVQDLVRKVYQGP